MIVGRRSGAAPSNRRSDTLRVAARSAGTGSRAPADANHVVLYGANQNVRLLLRRLWFSLSLVSDELGVRIYRKSGVRDPIATGVSRYSSPSNLPWFAGAGSGAFGSESSSAAVNSFLNNWNQKQK